MESELMQQLRVDDPMEEPELNLDGLQINSIQVLLEPPTSLPGGGEDDDGFYSPLDHFQNLVKLSMSSAQCQSLEAFPHLPLLRSLMLADNNLSRGFEALAEADLQSLVRLDLSGNKIADVSVLEPLDALGNLQYLMLAENEIANKENYREAVFNILPQLITIDGLDRDGTEIEMDDDEVLSGDEGVHYAEGNVEEDEGEYEIDDAEGDLDEEDEEEQDDEYDHPVPQGGRAPARHPVQYVQDDESEDIGSQDENDEEDEDVRSESDSELEDQENRRPMVGGKTSGEPHHVEDDEDDDDELDEDDYEDEGGVQHLEQHQHHQGQHHHHHHQDQDHVQQQQLQHYEIASGSDEDEEEDEEDEDEEEDDDLDEEDDDIEEEEGPGLAMLLQDDIPDDNDEEFEPGNEVEEESEIESSDEDEYGSNHHNNINNNGLASTTVISTSVSVSTVGMMPAVLSSVAVTPADLSFAAAAESTTNGHHLKRPRSPLMSAGSTEFDHDQAAAVGGFDALDGDDDANGFDMVSFDGEEEASHDSKRTRT